MKQNRQFRKQGEATKQTCIQISPPQNQSTGVNNGLFKKCASKLPTTRSAISFLVSMVPLPTWGKRTTFSSPKSSSGTLGSSWNTSSPAPPNRPSTSAETSSGSSTWGPLPILIRTPFGPNALMTSRLIMWRVSSVNAHATTRIWQLAANSTTLG